MFFDLFLTSLRKICINPETIGDRRGNNIRPLFSLFSFRLFWGSVPYFRSG